MRTSTANVGGVTLRDGEKLAVAFPHLRNGDSIPLHLMMVKIEGWWWCEGEKKRKRSFDVRLFGYWLSTAIG